MASSKIKSRSNWILYFFRETKKERKEKYLLDLSVATWAKGKRVSIGNGTAGETAGAALPDRSSKLRRWLH